MELLNAVSDQSISIRVSNTLTLLSSIFPSYGTKTNRVNYFGDFQGTNTSDQGPTRWDYDVKAIIPSGEDDLKITVYNATTDEVKVTKYIANPANNNINTLFQRWTNLMYNSILSGNTCGYLASYGDSGGCQYYFPTGTVATFRNNYSTAGGFFIDGLDFNGNMLVVPNVKTYTNDINLGALPAGEYRVLITAKPYFTTDYKVCSGHYEYVGDMGLDWRCLPSFGDFITGNNPESDMTTYTDYSNLVSILSFTVVDRPTVKVWANDVQTRYSAPYNSRVKISWNAINFVNQSSVKCSYSYLENGSPVTVSGQSSDGLFYVNPKTSTNYSVTCASSDYVRLPGYYIYSDTTSLRPLGAIVGTNNYQVLTRPSYAPYQPDPVSITTDSYGKIISASNNLMSYLSDIQSLKLSLGGTLYSNAYFYSQK